MNEEIVFSCSNDTGGRGLKIAAWSPGKGAVQRTYSCEAQGGGAALALLGKTYLLCALKSLPFIYIWHLRKVLYEVNSNRYLYTESQEQVHMKVACPGLVQCIATTPDDVYCVGGIAEKIYVWQVYTHTNLIIKPHYIPSL